MSEILSIVFLLLAFFSSLFVVAGRSSEVMLLGAIFCSIGLSAAVQFVGGGYYGVLMLAVLLATDTMLFFYFRSSVSAPARSGKIKSQERIYRVFLLWLSLGAAVLGVYSFIENVSLFDAKARGVVSFNLFHEKLWTNDWLLISTLIIALCLVVTGGFYLVRREKNV